MSHPEAEVDDRDIPPTPRWQSGSSPQHLLVTLLGDYWMAAVEPVSSAALVALLGRFGVTPAGARAALSRLGRRGVLETSRLGRRTYYALNPSVTLRLLDGGVRIASFGADDAWDGCWTVVAYSLPEDHRDRRHLLRSRLRWLGFAPIYDAVWIAPRADVASVRAVVEELGVHTATVFRASHERSSFADRAPIEAWDLAAVRGVYDEFLARAARIAAQLEAGETSPSDALRARTDLMDTYRRIPSLDPGLPEALMPPGWPRARARAAFFALYDGLAPLAQLHVEEILARTDPTARAPVRATLSADLLAGRVVPH